MKHELTAREKQIFIEMPPLQSVLTLVVPTVLSQVIIVIYNLADTYFVGRANNPSMVAAVAICMPLLLMITGMANLFGIGGSSTIAQSLGTNNFKRARSVSAFAIWGAAGIILTYSLVLLFFNRPILMLLGANADTFGYCYHYMFWITIIGGLPTIMNTLLAHLIRSEGASKEASFGVSMGGIINLFLDPLFMFVILPPGHEVTGAAMATMVSNFVATAYFLIYIYRHRKGSVLSFNPKYISLGDRIPNDVISIGLPSFFMTILASFSNAVINNLFAHESSAAIAGMGVAKRINMLSFRVSTGITQGSLPLIAYSHAAENYDRMKKAIVRAAMLAVGFSSIYMCLSYAFGTHLVRFFINDADTIAYGSRFIRIICFALPLASTSMIAMMLFQATSNRLQATLMSMLRKGILDVPLMFILNGFIPLYGVAYATPIAEVISCLTAVVLVSKYLRNLATPESEVGTL
ncbi:MATE family efflux transporter [Fusibacter paucivorans]|uniref:Multidrug export protein MepA n=1 Tax=Fusibacter paucivorans TaxID=76009 RepID=A0ABS5PSF6_9FIRM|nr:MATE family efflux transporter [Fusibacter paucivorans]MBS7528088.1 MATE family efflux transporter [Fusibacter paucivorans]